MIGGSERKTLEVVYNEGEETTSHMVSRRLGVDTGYARLLCMNLAQKDFVDLKSTGKFRITYKGKRALGITDRTVEQKVGSHQAEFKKLKQERLGWDIQPNVRSDRNRGPGFHKPGQEKTIWTTSKVDRSGRHYSMGRGGAPIGKLLTQTTHPCGFCGGKGEKPKGTKCHVCKGSGKVSIATPAMVCAYCRGTGQAKPRSNITCTVCAGRGVVSVREPVTGCSRCHGSGSGPNDKLPCLLCKGKGVISGKMPMKSPVSSAEEYNSRKKFQMEQKRKNPLQATKRQRNPMASELEVLKVYEEAMRTGKVFNVGSYTKMSPAYLGMMVQSLAENGFLAAVAPRRYEITSKGVEFVAGKKSLRN